MTEEINWHAANARFLSAALAWLRAKLEQRTTQSQEPLVITQPDLPQPEIKSPVKAKRSRNEPVAESPAPVSDTLLESAPPSSLEQLASQLAVDTDSSSSDPPALLVLGRRLGLSPFELEILLLCAAMELDTSMAGLCARAQLEPTRPFPTFALALSLFGSPAWDALSPERPLRYWRLIEISQPGGQPLTSSALRADERIVSYLKGLNYLDDRLTPLLSPVEVPAANVPLPLSQQELADRIANRLRQSTAGASLPVIQLLGADSASKELVAAQAASHLRLVVYRISAAVLPSQASELETLARLWQRESMLLPLALYIDRANEAEIPPGSESAVNRLLARLSGVVFVNTRDVLHGLPENNMRVDVAKPTAAEQQAVWSATLGDEAGNSPALLAAQFSLSVSGIQQIANRVASEEAKADVSLHDRLWAASLVSTRPRLDTLAQRVEAKATWEDIVLPPAETSLLKQISAQVAQRSLVHESWGFGRKMNRGFGISALFAGDSGTGKTMAAEVIANDLKLNLYKIDLSAVVSKYIGETEKNLRRLFDAAEDGGAILFFDEADALFGKRSEVKDSHDRYANIEINYLLQRMEAYGGLAILATNLKSSIDPAFMRRLRFVVNFPHPSAEQRKAMWQKVFPNQTPTQELDMDRLARLNLTGANISGIALNSAFLAAQSGSPVTTALVIDSTRTELRKLGRVINELELRRLA